MIVAIDGPAGSGKSAAARRLAARLGFLHLDTGALYRAFTLRALRRGHPLDDAAGLARLVEPEAIRLEEAPGGAAHLWLDGEDVSAAIRTPEVTRAVSALAGEPAVRARVTALARALARGRRVVSDGRDTTTVVFPEAEVKVYVDASLDERARRRLGDFSSSGHATLFAEVRADIARRDALDRGRAEGPLRLAPDAWYLDSSAIPLDEVVARLAAHVAQVEARAGGGSRAERVHDRAPRSESEPGQAHATDGAAAAAPYASGAAAAAGAPDAGGAAAAALDASNPRAEGDAPAARSPTMPTTTPHLAAPASTASGPPPALRTAASEALFARAAARLPGGVSSPVRAFRHVGGTPLFMRRGEGCRVEDVDGNRFIDWCMSWGPLALGHAHPRVVEAVTRAARDGLTFGTPTPAELALAEAIHRLQPLCERVRFVSSGTEAVMSAVRVARGFTGRPLVVKFDGCYHGHADYLLVKAGSGLATAGQPDSAGVPAAIASTTVVLPLDDDAAVEALFRERGPEIACVLIEPVPANSGLLLQRPAFLERLRSLTRAAGALLIFDEVISGFRLGPRGAAGHYGIEPDLVTFGKVIGGGMPVGCYGGRAEVMRMVAPEGPVYQAGTLSGNPVAMAAGLATLEVLEGGGWRALEERSARLAAALEPVLAAAPFPIRLVRLGSIGWLHLGNGEPPRAWHAVDRAGAATYARLHAALLRRGVYLAPSAFEVFFVSSAHTDDAVAETAAAFASALAEVGSAPAPAPAPRAGT